MDEVVAEVGSGMNGKRRRFARLLADPTATTIVVEHRDRLARFGVEYLEAALGAQGRRVLVVESGERQDDVIGDMTEVLNLVLRPPAWTVWPRSRADKALRCDKADAGPMALAQDR